MCLNSVGGRPQKCDWRYTWRQIKPIYMWYPDLVFKRLRQINCLNTWGTNCAIS